MSFDLPEHIRPEWLPIVARMQQVACSQSGMAILKVVILVSPEGNPSFWIEPELKRIEPRSRAELIRQLMAP